MIKSNDLMFLGWEVRMKNKPLWGRWADLFTVDRKCKHVKVTCGQRRCSGLNFVWKGSKKSDRVTVWVLDVNMGHTLLGVLRLFCEYICDFLCDFQYLYQCSSCVDMNFVADVS